jgi:NAD-dependent DNA ligase
MRQFMTETLTLEVHTFIYQSARGEITFRVVGGISEGDGYLQALDLVKGELRTFRLDRILERMDPGSLEAEVMARLAHWKTISPEPTPRPRPAVGTLTVCFTGFKAADKVALGALAEAKGMFIRAGVSQDLSILVGGYNAGPAKLERARHQGVMILNEEQFRHLLESGEIPTE